MRIFAPDGPPARAAAPPSAASAAGDGDPHGRHARPRRDAAGPPQTPARSVALERLLRFFVEPPTPPASVPGERLPVHGSSDGEPAPDEVPPAEPPPATSAVTPPGAAPDVATPAITPPDAAPDVSPAALVAPRVVVLGSPADVAAVARAVALRLAATDRRGASVVATWCADPAADFRRPSSGLRSPVRPAAARLATALGAGGHAAHAAGRLAHVHLDLARGPVAEAERVQDAAGHAPVVLALGGGRGAEWDRLLPDQHLVLLAVGPAVPPALAAIALAGTRELCGATPVASVSVTAGRRPRASREHLKTALRHVAAR